MLIQALFAAGKSTLSLHFNALECSLLILQEAVLILIALGANLPSRFGEPEETLKAAIKAIVAEGLEVLKVSSIWLTAPVPASKQPWYRNAVVSVQTNLNAGDLMRCLQKIEEDFGRERSVKNAPRALDLDILAFNHEVHTGHDCVVPHPRMHERAFVLMPLAEVAPTWRHPVLALSVQDLINEMPEGQEIEISEKRAA